jgi:hypothetical protein
MKHFIKYVFGVAVAALLTTGCETTELDIRDNPNSLTPEQADVNLFLNAIQIKHGELIEDLGFSASTPVRLITMQDRQYVNAFSPEAFNGEWDDAYREILADIRAMTPLAIEANQFKHLGIAQIIEVNAISTLVDFFGDIPYSDAIKANEGNLNPKLDSGAEIYAALIELLDLAIENLNRSGSAAAPAIDFYYGNDFNKWEKLANTLKMKLLLQTRIVDNTAISKFQAIEATDNYLKTADEDFEFKWGINEVQPDTRHPSYAANYIPQGAGDYMSHWLMDLMLRNNDPRRRYYFYRQTNTTPGQDGTRPNEETLSCSLDVVPQHYIDFYLNLGREPLFCGMTQGYWGRDHGDDEGIPPDGLLRTTWGVYPVAGNFDDDRFSEIDQGQGGAGAGITPIMLSSWVDFMKAEVALVNGNTTLAKQYILEGIAKHVEKVQEFGSLDPEADSDFFTDQADSQDFQDAIDAAFDAGSVEEKWNLLAEQLFVSNFGNGIIPFNFYRRTGFPNTLQPNREPNPGGFIRSFRYPSNLTNNNTNAQQRQNVTTKVFWDDNPDSPGFPTAN